MTDPTPILTSDILIGGVVLVLAFWGIAGSLIGIDFVTGWLRRPLTDWPRELVLRVTRKVRRRRTPWQDSAAERDRLMAEAEALTARFVYAECPECEYELVAVDPAWLRDAAGLPVGEGWIACPVCQSDSGHQVEMQMRPALPEDRPEGLDMRKLSAAELAGFLAATREARRQADL